MKTQKQRLNEAYGIHSSAHRYMGYRVCDGEEDLLVFRKWVLQRERRAVNNAIAKFKRKHNGDDEM